MGLFSNIILFVSSLFIIGLGIFLIKHKNKQKNVADYITIVGALCIFLGIIGIFFIVYLEFF